jgi:hypothetical protein
MPAKSIAGQFQHVLSLLSIGIKTPSWVLKLRDNDDSLSYLITFIMQWFFEAI